MSENTVKHTPGPWAVGYRAIDVVCTNVKIGGPAKLFDVRGWGYLTGNGHGGLGLDDETAYEIQKANAALAAAAPDLLEALQNLAHEMRFMLRANPTKDGGLYRQRLDEADAAISKATGA